MSGRVMVSRAMVGICHMQVCCVPDATDEEILAVANAENPAGTTFGWSSVIRNSVDEAEGPVQCQQDNSRIHLLLVC